MTGQHIDATRQHGDARGQHAGASVLLAGAALVHGDGAPLVRALVAMVVLSGFYWLGTAPRRGGR